MITKIQRSKERGYANYGWLETYYSFSFADYYNPNKINFGAIRVLNDDIIKANTGFGLHPHKNMEIITIPLDGELLHGDSMQNQEILKKGEIQIMSAGTGIQHFEKNPSNKNDLKLLQIWILPNEIDVKPRYNKVNIDSIKKINDFYNIISPEKNHNWIYQECWFYLGSFNKSLKKEYILKNKNNGLYIFVIQGSILINNNKLNSKDTIEITDLEKIDIDIEKGSELLFIETIILDKKSN